MKFKSIILVSLATMILLVACHKVPITGRRQAKLLPNATLNQMAVSQYTQFLSDNRARVQPASGTEAAMVRRVGKRVQDAVERYFHARGKSDYLKGYKWEFNVVQEDMANAWCMPGGKVVVYTGILPITKNEDGLAVVMGHEIAHAIANHGNERMSQMMVAQAGGQAVNLAAAATGQSQSTQNMMANAYGVGVQIGALLPFSRLHESEADEMGLIFMAMAGYNPEESVPFWQRMAAKGGATPPQFMSTHPSPATRIAKLKEKIPYAKAYAKKFGTSK